MGPESKVQVDNIINIVLVLLGSPLFLYAGRPAAVLFLSSCRR